MKLVDLGEGKEGEDSDMVAAVARVAHEDAAAANEQAAARKADEKEEKELRAGTALRKREDGTSISKATLPAVEGGAPPAAPPSEGKSEQVDELLRRAEEEKKQKETQEGEMPPEKE